MDKNIALVKEKLMNADMILVALGDEFGAEDLLENNVEYAQICQKLAENQLEWLVPYVQKHFLKSNHTVEGAIRGLEKALAEKNYYILSTIMSGIVENSVLKQDRMVNICGSISENSYEEFQNKKEMIENYIHTCIKGENTWESLKKFMEEKQVQDFEYNTLYSEKFTEEIHKEDWNRYLKWLQGTLNKKVVILELGVGLRYLNVLRLRCEKICEMNQKAYYIRVHKSFYQTPSQIGEKCLSVCASSIDFMDKYDKIC